MTKRQRNDRVGRLSSGSRFLGAAMVVTLSCLFLGWKMMSANSVGSPQSSPHHARTDTPANPAEEETVGEEVVTRRALTASTSTPDLPPELKEPKDERRPVRLAGLTQRLRFDGDDAKRLAAAREVMAKGLGGVLRGRALETLAQLDPSAVAPALRKIIRDEAEEPARSLNSKWIRNLGNRQGVFSRDDLDFFFATGPEDVREAVATVLSHRGDDSLLAYIK